MEFLVESFPVVFGLLLGVTLERVGGLRPHTIAWGAGSAALGAFATLCSGEYRESLLYFAVDIGLVAAVSAGTAVLLGMRRYRPRRD